MDSSVFGNKDARNSIVTRTCSKQDHKSSREELPKDVGSEAPQTVGKSIANENVFGHAINIPLNMIDYDERTLRGNPQERSLKRMAISIGKVGVIQPILVRKERGLYKIVLGHRRVAAARMNGKETIPAIVLSEDSNPLDDAEMRIVENTNREDFKPLALAKAIEDRFKSSRPELDRNAVTNLFNNYDRQSKHNTPDATVTSILEITGRSASTIRNHLNLLRLPDEVKKAIDNNTLKPSLAYIIANNIGHPDFDSIWTTAVNSKISKRELEILFKMRAQLPEDIKQFGIPAQYFLNKIRTLKIELKEKSNLITHEEAGFLFAEIDGLQVFARELMPIAKQAVDKPLNDIE